MLRKFDRTTTSRPGLELCSVVPAHILATRFPKSPGGRAPLEEPAVAERIKRPESWPDVDQHGATLANIGPKFGKHGRASAEVAEVAPMLAKFYLVRPLE